MFRKRESASFIFTLNPGKKNHRGPPKSVQLPAIAPLDRTFCLQTSLGIFPLPTTANFPQTQRSQKFGLFFYFFFFLKKRFKIFVFNLGHESVVKNRRSEHKLVNQWKYEAIEANPEEPWVTGSWQMCYWPWSPPRDHDSQQGQSSSLTTSCELAGSEQLPKILSRELRRVLLQCSLILVELQMSIWDNGIKPTLLQWHWKSLQFQKEKNHLKA